MADGGRAEVGKKAKRDLGLEDRAWEAWNEAWDSARDADHKAGRQYDRRIYAEKAHDARAAVLGGAS